METQQIWDTEPDIEALGSAVAVLHSDPGRAMLQFQTLEHRGSIRSLVYLGYIFETGLGVNSDLVAAEGYYRRAYEAGSTEGLFLLGALYWKLKNYKDAQKTFAIGAERNEPRSLYWLARIYLRGTSDFRCIENAAKMLEKAASLGHLQSQRHLGKILMSGRLGLSRIFQGVPMYLGAAIAGAKIAAHDPLDERVRDLPL